MSEPIDFNSIFVGFVRKHQLALDGLTEQQLADAIRQALPDFQRNIHADSQQVVYIPGNEAARYRHLYHELLSAVESKFMAETRHDTALRYIQEVEINQ